MFRKLRRYKDVTLTKDADAPHEKYLLKRVKLIKFWVERPFRTWKHWAYLKEDGRVFVYIQTWFINLESIYLEEHKTEQEFMDCHFPQPEIEEK